MKKETKARIEANAADMKNRCEEEISRMTEEVAQADAHEDMMKSAGQLHDMYMSYIEAGFTEEQAWELTTIAFTNATKRTLF